MQINIATGDAVIHAVQNGEYEKVTASSRTEQLERRIALLKRHLAKYDCDEQTRRDFEEWIGELEEEIRLLN